MGLDSLTTDKLYNIPQSLPPAEGLPSLYLSKYANGHSQDRLFDKKGKERTGKGNILVLKNPSYHTVYLKPSVVGL